MRTKSTSAGSRSEAGSILVFVTVGMLALLGLTAFALETGQIWNAKGQLQGATDAAALAGAGSLLIDDGEATDPAAAVAAAQAYGPQHRVIGTPIEILAGDVQTGSWDMTTRVFTPLPGETDPDVVRAVRVLGRRDAVQNGEVATFLGRVFGVDGIPVDAQAIGYMGFAGIMPPDTAALPIAIDCCAIAGNTPGALCEADFCDWITNHPPNPCPLVRDPSKTVTCLEFASTGEQNACWTAFGTQDAAVSSRDLNHIIDSRNDYPVGPDPIYVDNGTKTTVVDRINDRFLGTGPFNGEPDGQDTDGDGVIDSWVVALPVIECQNPGDGCSQGDPSQVKGVVCFDIQEVTVTPDKIVRGEFLCSTDPRFERCGTGGMGPGGEVDAGVDAQAPVLVR